METSPVSCLKLKKQQHLLKALLVTRLSDYWGGGGSRFHVRLKNLVKQQYVLNFE